MQRGTRLTLAVAILLAGATAAMMFRRETPAVDSTASLPASSIVSSDKAASIAERLVGQIENHDPAPTAAPHEIAPAPLAVVPAAAVLPRQDHYFVDSQLNSGADAAKTHRVRDGDTLSELARRYLGRRERFLEIFEANRDKLATPDLLPIGKELRIPSAGQESSWNTGPPSDAGHLPQSADIAGASAEPAASLGVIRHVNGPPRPSRTYRVQNEETLVQVAERVYGNPARYRDLYEANRDRLDSPQNLRPGTILFVP